MNTAAPHADVLRWCEEAMPLYLKNLETLTNMDSGTDDHEGLAAKCEVLVRLLRETGAQVETPEAAPPRQGTRNIVATWRGAGKAKILYLAHYDTVWPKGEAAKRPFHIENGMAYGPGVSDRQSSCAGFPIFMDILLNKMNCTDFHTITVCLNADEETGSFGSRDLIMDLAGQHDVTLSTDGSCPDGNEVHISSRGNAGLDLRITGVEAHSGGAPEKGRNAGYELIYQLSRLMDLSDKEKGTDVNWTLGGFGTKANVIPGVAHAHANIRVTTMSEINRVEREVREAVKDQRYPESQISLSVTTSHPPFERNPASDALAAKMAALYKNELGRDLRAVPGMGGRDSGYSSQTAPVALDGFCLGGYASHSLNESLNLDNVPARFYLWLRTAEEIMKGGMLPLRKAQE